MAADEVVERELRQLSLILDRLDRLQSGELGIGGVIGDLEGLADQLQVVDEAWRERFSEGWGDLEIPYAVALARQEPIPTVKDPIVAEGVDTLDQLVRDHLASLRT